MTQAQVQVSVNGGAWQSGGILGVPFGATLNFQNATSSGVRSYVWELLDYPPGLSLPAGWSNVGGIYTYAAGASPPQITLPASGSNNWGKIAVRLRLNGNPLQFDATGALQQSYVQSLTDTSTMLSIASPGASMPGFAFTEATQYDSMRSWPGAVMANLRALDAKIGGVSQFFQQVNDANFDFNGLTGGNTTAQQSFVGFKNLSAARTCKFPSTPVLGQQITVYAMDISVTGAASVSVDPASNLLITQGATLQQTGTSTVALDHRYQSGTWLWDSHQWQLIAWVFSSGAP